MGSKPWAWRSAGAAGWRHRLFAVNPTQQAPLLRRDTGLFPFSSVASRGRTGRRTRRQTTFGETPRFLCHCKAPSLWALFWCLSPSFLYPPIHLLIIHSFIHLLISLLSIHWWDAHPMGGTKIDNSIARWKTSGASSPWSAGHKPRRPVVLHFPRASLQPALSNSVCITV